MGNLRKYNVEISMQQKYIRQPCIYHDIYTIAMSGIITDACLNRTLAPANIYKYK